LATLILNWHKTEVSKENSHAKNPSIIRTYHAVENRVKDHESGFQQTWDEVLDDVSDMIAARHRYLTDNSPP
jgi:hypothetical protein